MIKAIAFDLDGTLLGRNEELYPETKEALTRLYNKGIEIILATGRSYAGSKEIAKKLELPVWVLCYNGCRVVDSTNDEVIFEKSIESDTARSLARISREEKVHLNLYLNDVWVVEDENGEWSKEYSHRTSLPIKEIDFLATEDLTSPKGVFLAPHERLEELKPRLISELGDKLDFMYSQNEYLEIVTKNLNKGKTLKEILKLKGIDISECMAFGDGGNDKEMLESCGVSIAMKNAGDKLKEIAKFTTEFTNEDGGVHKFLEKYFSM